MGPATEEQAARTVVHSSRRKEKVAVVAPDQCQMVAEGFRCNKKMTCDICQHCEGCCLQHFQLLRQYQVKARIHFRP